MKPLFCYECNQCGHKWESNELWPPCPACGCLSPEWPDRLEDEDGDPQELFLGEDDANSRGAINCASTERENAR